MAHDQAPGYASSRAAKEGRGRLAGGPPSAVPTDSGGPAVHDEGARREMKGAMQWNRRQLVTVEGTQRRYSGSPARRNASPSSALLAGST